MRNESCQFGKIINLINDEQCAVSTANILPPSLRPKGSRSELQDMLEMKHLCYGRIKLGLGRLLESLCTLQSYTINKGLHKDYTCISR